MSDNANSGFSLPSPDDTGSSDSAPQFTQTSSPDFGNQLSQVADTLVRDAAIGAGVMVVLMIVFFFMKNAFAQSLVAKKRFSPTDANNAGWWLFGFLSTSSLAVILMVINPLVFLVPQIMAGLAILPVITLIQTLRSSNG